MTLLVATQHWSMVQLLLNVCSYTSLEVPEVRVCVGLCVCGGRPASKQQVIIVMVVCIPFCKIMNTPLNASKASSIIDSSG